MSNKSITAPVQETIDQVTKMDLVFDQYHGNGCELRYGQGTNIVKETQKVIVKHSSTKDIQPSVVNLFIKIKIFMRLRAMKNIRGEKNNLRNIVKVGHVMI